MALPPKTVLIKHVDFPDGLLINADDFDPSVHQLVDLDVAIPAALANEPKADVLVIDSE